GISISDLNGDGKPDILTNDWMGGISIMVNSSTQGNISLEEQMIIGVGGFPLSIATADLNRDSTPEIIVSNWEVEGMRVIHNFLPVSDNILGDINGYLYQHDVSDCQDPCSQYYIEPEIDGGFGTIPIIFENPNINIDIYMNRFVTVDLGQEVTCVECSAFEVLEINISQDCEFPVACFVDPCMVEECQINTPVDCISNYCDGCYADFYDLEGNLVDCNSSVNDCIDLSGIPFPECGSVIGFGYIEGECQTMYCSPIDGYGVDWSNWIYNTIEGCEEVCGTNNPITLGDINFDGDINILDVVLLVSFILGEPNDEYEHMAADINGDSNIDILDIVQLVNIILN
ncbi:MAG: hypothetical protein HOA66_00500, partial [Candidatus Marinimicrobia bacterium]|nr:hypothetical protein [Candidatus Neomarinimicrobiota bacterium]